MAKNIFVVDTITLTKETMTRTQEKILTIKGKTYDLADPDCPAKEIHEKIQTRLEELQFDNPADKELWELDEYSAWYDAGEPTGNTLRQYIFERWDPISEEITPGPTVPKTEEIVASDETINHKWNLEEATKIYKETRKEFVEKHIESVPGKPNLVRKREDSEIWSQPRYKSSQSWARVFKREADRVATDAVKAWALEQSIWKASGLSDDKISFLEIRVAWREVHWIDHPMFKEPLPSVKPTEETKAENADTPPQEVRAPQIIKSQEKTPPPTADSPVKEESEPEVKNAIHFAGRPNVRTGALIQDWTKSSVDKHRPFFDSVKQEYLLSWKTKYEGTGGEETSEEYQLRAQELKKQGCKWLLDFFFKKYDDELLTKLTKVSNHEYYIKDRPKSKMKVLVKIPARYFDAIVTKDEDFSWDSDEVTKRRVTLSSSDIEKDINSVIEELRSYDDIIKSSGARIAPGPSADAQLQKKHSLSYKEDFAPDLYKLWKGLQQIFKHNNLEIRKDKDDIIEIGFSQGFREITYILYGDSDDQIIEMLPLRFGFNAFKYFLNRRRNKNRTFRTGNGLLFYLSEATEYLKKNPGSDRWLKFTQSYINPSVLIYPAGALEPARQPGAEEEIELQRSTDTGVASGPYVTSEEKRADDRVVNDQEVRKKIADRRDREEDPVAPPHVETPEDIEEAYAKKYNKTDHRLAARAAMTCLLKIMPDSEIKTAFENSISIADPVFNYQQPGARSKMVATVCPSMKRSHGTRSRSRLPNLDKITWLFPDDNPIISDTMVWEAKQIEQSMDRMLKTLVNIAEFPLSVCENIDNLLRQFDNLLNQFDRLRNTICRELQVKLGLQPGLCPDPFIDDMFASMTDRELKDLFDGNPGDDSLEQLADLLDNHSLPISPEFFFGMPNDIEPLGCIPSFNSIECPDQFFDNLINQRKALLAKGGTTSDQINKQILKEKEDRINGLKKLADLLNADNLDHLVPPMDSCTEKEAERELSEDLNESSLTPPAASLAPKQPESMDYMTNKVINQIYSQTEQSFDSDCRAYIESIIEISEEPKEKISLYKLNDEHTKYANPESRELIDNPTAQTNSQFPSEDYDPAKNFESGGKTIIHSDNMEIVRGQKVLPHLKSSLSEFNNSLITYGGSSYIFGAALYNFNASVEGLSEPVVTYATNLASQQKKELDSSVITVKELVHAPIVGYNQEASNVEDRVVYGDPIINQASYTSKSLVTVKQKIEELAIEPDSFNSPPQSQVFSKLLLKNIPSEIKNENTRTKLENYWPHNYAEYQKHFAELISQASFFDREALGKMSLLPPAPTEREIAPCKGSPKKSLLDLNGMKSKVKQAFIEESDCTERPQSDEQSKAMSPLESAGTEGALYTIIRLFAVEVLLNSAPVFSVFRAEDISRDDIFLNFALKKISDDLKVFDPIFYDELASFALKTLNKRKEKTGELKDPITEEDVSLLRGTDAMRFIIKEQLLAVSDDIDNIFGPEANANDLMKDKILNEWIGPEQTIPEVELDPRGSGRYVTQPRFSEKENFESGGGFTQKTNPQFANGQFFLERYFKIDENENPLSAFSSQIPEHLKGIVNMKQWQEWAKWNIKEEFAQTNIDTRLDIKMGVRLMYLPPLENFSLTRRINTSMIGEESDGVLFDYSSTFEFSSLFGSKTLDNPSALYSKAFAVTELLQSGETSFLDSEHEHSIKGDLERVVNPIPIVVIEKSAHEMLAKAGVTTFGDIKDNNIDWPRVTLENNPTTDWYSPESIKVISEFLTLKEELKNSEEFDIVFNYCYNMSRLSSLFTIYCTTVTRSSNKAIKSAFDPTKQALKSLFHVLTKSPEAKPYYSFKNPTAAEHGTNAQMKKSVDNVISTDGPIGFPTATRLAANTIPMMIKGYAEESDPSIKLMKSMGLPTVWSSVPKVLPMNVFGPPPFGIGIGPPLTPLGFLALGLNFKTPYEKYRERNQQEDNYLEEQETVSPQEECDTPENEQEEIE